MSLLFFLAWLVYMCALLVYGDDDTNDDSVCDTEIRTRKPWQLLTRDEKSLYVDGYQYLRKNKILNAISTAHAHNNNAIFIHYSSLNFYWHSYVIWELETQIRNLGGRFKCFALPYWDSTLDAGMERHPSILNSGIGGNGDVGQSYCVENDNYYDSDDNGIASFNWQLPGPEIEHPRHSDSSFYWSNADSCIDGEVYPMCCLKRSLSSTVLIPSAAHAGNMLKQRNTGYRINEVISNKIHAFVHMLFSNNDVVQFGKGCAADDPMFFLFHSYIEYLRLMWTSCQGYDSIDKNDLDDYSNVYHGTCIGVGTFLTKKECENKVKPRGLGIDDPMYFWQIKGIDGAVCSDEDITVRKMWNPSDWNVQYELGSFHKTSNTDLWCSKDDLNSDWFVETMDYDLVFGDLSPVNEYILKEKEKMINDGYSSHDIIEALSSKSCKYVRENSENSCWDETMESIEIETCDDLSLDEIGKLSLDDLLGKKGVSEHECLQKVRTDAWEYADNSWWGRATKRMLCNGEMDYQCDEWIDTKSDNYEEFNNNENVNLIDAATNDYKSEQMNAMVYVILFAFFGLCFMDCL